MKTSISEEEKRKRTNERINEWRRKHPERVRAYLENAKARDPEAFRKAMRKRVNAWKKRNPEKVSANKAKWRENNPQKVKEIKSRSYRKRPEKYIERAAKRRALEIEVSTGDPKTIVKWVKAWRSLKRVSCYWCHGSFSPKKCHMDHIQPISKGGAHSIENLCIACQPCNSSKHDKTLSEWNQRISQPTLL